MPQSNPIKGIEAFLAETIQVSDRILVVYLFGSFLGESQKRTSDIDLAFLINEKRYVSDSVQAVSPAFLIAAKLGMVLDKETDVTVLNSASLEIAYEVITTGRCIYEVEPERRFEYESKMRGMYFDFRPFIEQLRAESMNRLSLKKSG
ncbi:MAG: hypothetical protein JEZ11_11715 [Desulfobacterales bacterium]|nr:hypothetical protein [Desulfobacterales bacterium]